MLNALKISLWLPIATAIALPIAVNAAPLLDYGDALVSYGSPSHVIDNTLVYLGGVAPDAELSPLWAFDSRGDNDSGTDDEEGVTFKGSWYDIAGTESCGPDPFDPLLYRSGCWGKVDVAVTILDLAVGSIFLDGWLDYSHNGVFGDSEGDIVWGPLPGTHWSEHIISSVLDPTVLGVGTHVLPYTFMNGEGPDGPFYARFRVSYGQGPNVPDDARDNGEVEDYGGSLRHGQTPTPATGWLIVAGLLALGRRRLLRQV